MELVWKYGRLSSIPFLKSSIPFHSGIFHIPYRNFRSIPLHFPFHSIPCPALNTRGGVLEDVLGLEDVLEDRFWSPWPWPWPRGLKSSKIGLSSARGQQYFWIAKILWSGWKIFWKAFFRGDRLKNFCEDFFFFFFFLEIAWKIFVKTFFFFFFWRALALCVFGPWPWPRAFLSLASRVSVLGKAVLGLGFFLCPWPWPRALCPRLHLCSIPKNECEISCADMIA